MEDNNVSYYAVIPANVRYDKRLTPNAKLLYGEITALCNKKGYCWSNNQYFAKLYGVSKQSISSWISKLKQLGYISIKLIYKEGSKEILNRYIRISEYPIQDILNTPIQENLKDNNTKPNNTSLILHDVKTSFDIFWNLYDKKIGSRKKIESKWNKLPKNEKEKILDYIPMYIKSQPNKKFRKNAETFLNNESWNDELIFDDTNSINKTKQTGADEWRELGKQIGI